ncbi:hypothetical protein ID866_7015 [Astraeus odoratus]|nr:hypothetical protein ID866_7015 [Astraeus odoratus]
MVLLRFAPSPTGALHLGGLRTALYNHLYAKKLGGQWILRIEDTDSTRYVPGAVDGIRSALEWAGLHYDFDKLVSTRERLARTGSNATYDKACLHLTEEEVSRRVRAGEKSIVRFNDDKLPEREVATDLVFGSLRDAHASLPTDPVLLKSDLFPTYHLACVVDDHEMGITHVLRGEEWLPSLPLHLDLYASLSLKPPQFAHLPILLNPDGSKMSKRKGNVSVLEFSRRGWEPEALLNWLALAGWGTQHDSNKKQSTSPNDLQAPESTAVMSLPELVEQFDLRSLTHRRNILDPAKLEYLNKHHLMRHWQNEEATAHHARRIRELVKSAFPSSQYATPDYIAKVIGVLQGRIVNVFDVPSLAPFFFIEPDYTTSDARSMRRSVSIDDYRLALETANDFFGQSLDGDTSNVSAVVHDVCNVTGLKQKTFMTALRHALSATKVGYPSMMSCKTILTLKKAGPSIPEIIMVLGPERTVSRLRTALSATTIE